MITNESTGYNFPTVGCLPLETPSEDLKPFFRRKYKTFFRSIRTAEAGVMTKADMQKIAEDMTRTLPEEEKKRRIEYWMNVAYKNTMLFKRDSITEDEFAEENIKKCFADPESRREWIKLYQPILKAIFDPIDANNNGVIEPDEWENLWKVHGVADTSKAKGVFHAMDADKDGVVSLVEFQYAWLYFLMCSGPDSPFSNWFGYLVD